MCAPSLLEGQLPLTRLEDLSRHMLLHPSRDEHDWRLWLQAAGASIELNGPRQHFETLDMAMAMASQGTGVAIGDWALVGDDLRSGRLCMPFGLKVLTGKGYYGQPCPEPAAGVGRIAGLAPAQARPDDSVPHREPLP